MVATADVKNKLMNKVDRHEVALLGLTQMVAENREMLRAIIEHLQVPYNKPPMGFRAD